MKIGEPIGILLIEDEDFDVRRVKNTIEPFKHYLKIREIVSNGLEALALIEKDAEAYPVVIMDYQIAGGLTGERLIRKIKAIDDAIQIIVITKMTINITDFEFANRLMEAGAMWYCTKYPGDIEEFIYQPTDFILSIINAAEKRRLELEKKKSSRRLSQNVASLLEERQIIGNSPATNQLREQILLTSESDTTILIRGKSGTGKELVASNIHYHSKRKYEKFVPINCGSIPHDLIESELFGFEKGAFTGAGSAKQGLLELANKGTAFLDEVGELPPSAQVKLLRFLQEGEIDKIGRTKKMNTDIRIIAATNKNLEEQVKEGKFREDLYYRLNVFPIWVKPLIERRDDIRQLAEFFFKKFSSNMGMEQVQVDNDAYQLLDAYPWPGNVRELQNVIQRLLLVSRGHVDANIVSTTLGMIASIQKPAKSSLNSYWAGTPLVPWREREMALRKSYFSYVRENSRSDAEAARKLGLAPPNYHRMCKEIGLK